MPKIEEEHTLIVSFFLYLAHSKRYKDLKNFFRRVFKDNDCKFKIFIDYTLIFLVISSVAIFVYEVNHKIPFWMEFYAFYFTSFIFLIEYLINMWLYNNIHESVLKEYHQSKATNIKPQYHQVISKAVLKKLSYALTPVAIIDLLAILPAYRPLRFLRILVLFRFLKVLKYSNSLYQFILVLKDRRFELFTLLALFIFLVFIGALAIYILEERLNSNINNFFDAIYWSFITITTVGYGDISPITISGKIVSFVIVILGITIVSFATSVIVSSFSDKLIELKKDKIKNYLNKRGNFLIICGYSQLTKVFLQKNRELVDSKNYVILDKNCKRVQDAINDGYIAFCEDASRYEVLKRYIQNLNVTILTLTGSDIENIYITLNVKSINQNLRVIASARDKKVIKKYRRAGADSVILPNDMASLMLVNLITNRSVYKVVNAILNSKEVSIIDEVYIKNSKLIGKTIKEANFKEYNLIIFGIEKRDNKQFIYNPKSDYLLEDSDIVIILGHKKSISYFKKINRVEI